jgi:hypothetical protein
MNTFEKDITFFNPAFFDGEKHIEKEETKVCTFKDLSRIDRDQHELHFMIMNAYEIRGNKVKFDPTQVLDMTDKFIEICMITSTDASIPNAVTEQDRSQILNDSLAKLDFGRWLLKEKFAPFFSQLVRN